MSVTARIALLAALLSSPAFAQELGPPVRCGEAGAGPAAPTRAFRGRASVGHVQWSADGATLFLTDDEHRLLAWDATTGAERWAVDPGHGSVHALVRGPEHLVVGHAKGVSLHDPATGALVRALHARSPAGLLDAETTSEVMFVPGGEEVVIATYRAVRVHGADGAVRRTLWELPADRRAEMRHVVLSPDGRRVAALAARDAALVDVASGEVVRALPPGGWTLCFSPDGRQLMVGSNIIDVATAAEVCALKNPEGAVGAVWADWTAERLLVAWDKGGLASVDPATGTVKGRAPLRDGLRGQHLALSPDGRRLAVALENGVTFVDPATLGEQATSDAHLGDLQVAFLPDGELLTGGAEGTVRRWDAAKGEQEAVLLGDLGRVSAIAVDPTGRYIAAGGADAVKVVAVAGGAATRVGDHGVHRPGRLAFDAEGTRLAVNGEVHAVGGEWPKVVDASVSIDGAVGLAAGAMVSERGVVDLTTRLALRAGFTEEREQLAALSADTRQALTVLERRLRLVEVSTGQAVWTFELPDDPVPAAWRGFAGSTSLFERPPGAFGPGGLVALGRRGRVLVLDAADGEVVGQAVVDGEVTSLAFSPDGRRLAVGTGGGVALVYPLPARPVGKARAARPARLPRLAAPVRLVWPGDAVLVEHDLERREHVADLDLRGFTRTAVEEHLGLTLEARGQRGVARHALELAAPVTVELEAWRPDDSPPGARAKFAIVLGELALLWGDVPADARTLAPLQGGAASRLQGEDLLDLTISFDGREVVVTKKYEDAPVLRHTLAKPAQGKLRLSIVVQDMELQLRRLRLASKLP